MRTYKPEVFLVNNLEQAKAIILTPEGSTTTQQRWEHETPILGEQLIREIAPLPEHLVLDYGCGVGRVARELIQRTNCYVVGVDISVSMLQLAPGYVFSNNFCGMPPFMLDRLVQTGARFDSAYAIWTIQHCIKPDDDFKRIASALKPGGMFHLVNTSDRSVPTNDGWVDDGIDLVALMRTHFSDVRTFPCPRSIAPTNDPEAYYCATCRK